MHKNLYIIEYDCAHWAGACETVLVWAANKYDAVDAAEVHMEETMRELYSGEYDVTYDEEYCENGYEDESAFNVLSVELFDTEHPEWQYYQEATQSEFYPVIGEPWSPPPVLITT